MNRYENKLQRVWSAVNTLEKLRFRDERRLSHEEAGLSYAVVPYLPMEEIPQICGYKPEDRSCDETMFPAIKWQPCAEGQLWGGKDRHCLFRFEVRIPESWSCGYRESSVNGMIPENPWDCESRPEADWKQSVKQKNVEQESRSNAVVFVSTGADDIWNTDNPQFLCYVNGTPVCGLDMNHNSILLPESAFTDSDPVQILLYAYSNHDEYNNRLDLRLALSDEIMNELYYDLRTPLEAAKAMEQAETPAQENADYRRIVRGLTEAVDIFMDMEVNPDAVYRSYESSNTGTPFTADPVRTGLANSEEGLTAMHEAARAASRFLQENLYGAGTDERDTSSPAAGSVPGGTASKSQWQVPQGKTDPIPDGSDCPRVFSTGHTHIDVAWKWPVRQTREKAVRSFSTALDLMKRYPSYHFFASTPQLYQFIREDAPRLYEQIKERVREGRFEPEGAMWLEPDCNLTGGESLVRQLIYGKRFFQKEFGVDCRILWLPDTFGYSAALPQILRKAGVRYFMTTKLSWNDTNRFPYDLFTWRGIDGSGVLAYCITTCDLKNAVKAGDGIRTLEYTYNGRQNPEQIMGTWRAFRQKELTNEALTCYGFGDGGGGPTEEMLEMDMRLARGIPGCPVTVTGSVGDFFRRLENKLTENNIENESSDMQPDMYFSGTDGLPCWSGELYLEYHRGTYTSMAEMKKRNRQLEFLLQEAETMEVMALAGLCDHTGPGEHTGSGVPAEPIAHTGSGEHDNRKGELCRGSATGPLWEKLLLNQFHDILPGSSIAEVYEDAFADLDETERGAWDIITASRRAVASRLADTGTGSCPGSASDGNASDSSASDDAVINKVAEPEKESALIAWHIPAYETSAYAYLEPQIPGDAGDQYSVSSSGENKEPSCGNTLASPAGNGTYHIPSGIESQQLSDGRTLLWLTDLPSKGYRIYPGENRAYSPDTVSDVHQHPAKDQVCSNASAGVSLICNETADVIEIVNPFYRAVVSRSSGELISLFDLKAKREVTEKGHPLGRLVAFTDRPREYDCWNIDADYDRSFRYIDSADSVTITDRGPLAVIIEVRRSFRSSSIVQRIIFYRDKARIDHDISLDWNEHQILLKADLPFDIATDEITCEIQYGNVRRATHRNTGWDQARFEQCAHKWIDVSEPYYGVAVLNDSRFGYDARGSHVRLTLLKSGIYPNENADIGKHRLVFSILPHTGDYREGCVIEEAYELNVPVRAYLMTGDMKEHDKLVRSAEKEPEIATAVCNPDAGRRVIRSDRSSLVSITDAGIPGKTDPASAGIYIDVCKLSEDGRGIVLRLYEGHGAGRHISLDLSGILGLCRKGLLPITGTADGNEDLMNGQTITVTECDLLERPLDISSDAAFTDPVLHMYVRPFDIRTFYISVQNRF